MSRREATSASSAEEPSWVLGLVLGVGMYPRGKLNALFFEPVERAGLVEVLAQEGLARKQLALGLVGDRSDEPALCNQ